MNAEMKNAWVAALRSGRYVQSEGQLRTDTYGEAEGEQSSFCCLGVLCEINDWPYDGDDGGVEFGPEELVGVSDENGDHTPGESELSHATREKLATMNDKGASFDVIATWIEREL